MKRSVSLFISGAAAAICLAVGAGPALAAPAVTVPTVPRSVTATVVSPSSATLKWVAPTSTGGSKITGYLVARDGMSTAGGGAYSTVTAATARSFTFQKLVAGATYHLSVSALNAKGASVKVTRTVKVPGTSTANSITLADSITLPYFTATGNLPYTYACRGTGNTALLINNRIVQGVAPVCDGTKRTDTFPVEHYFSSSDGGGSTFVQSFKAQIQNDAGFVATTTELVKFISGPAPATNPNDVLALSSASRSNASNAYVYFTYRCSAVAGASSYQVKVDDTNYAYGYDNANVVCDGVLRSGVVNTYTGSDTTATFHGVVQAVGSSGRTLDGATDNAVFSF